MDLTLDIEDYKLNIRAACIIKHNNKILLHKSDDKDHYCLIGGRVELGESSENTIKREIKEEIGWDNITYAFLALSEEFVTDKGYNNHQINIIYKGIYNDEIKETKFKGLEGDWINFEWVDVNNINNYKIFPEGIAGVINGRSKSNHFINNLIKGVESNE